MASLILRWFGVAHLRRHGVENRPWVQEKEDLAWYANHKHETNEDEQQLRWEAVWSSCVPGKQALSDAFQRDDQDDWWDLVTNDNFLFWFYVIVNVPLIIINSKWTA